jgi:hypothetical protein
MPSIMRVECHLDSARLRVAVVRSPARTSSQERLRVEDKGRVRMPRLDHDEEHRTTTGARREPSLGRAPHQSLGGDGSRVIRTSPCCHACDGPCASGSRARVSRTHSFVRGWRAARSLQEI